MYYRSVLEKYVADELHLYKAIRPDVVVSDGRSWSTVISVSVVGIPSNLDQYLQATTMRDAGAAVLLRAATVTPAKIRAAVGRVVREEGFTQAAQRVAASLASFDPHARFRAVIDAVTADGGRDAQRRDPLMSG